MYRLAFHLQGTSVLIRKAPGDDGMYKVSSFTLYKVCCTRSKRTANKWEVTQQRLPHI